MAFQVMTRTARMPSSCRGTYRRVAVVETVGDREPSMISARARGVVRVVRLWDRLNVGKTERCAYRVALAEAEAMASDMRTGFDMLLRATEA